MQAESATSGAGASVPGTPPRENLVRASSTIGLRGSESGMPTLTGHFAVWNQWTEIRSAYEGHFMERFAPASMTRTLEQSTPKVLFQHGKDNAIGEKPLGTVRSLQPDDQGAFYEVDLFDTAYNRELLPGLEAGAYGASFRFSVLREDMVQRPKKTDWNPRGIPERTVQEARVMEFGPVTFPAYAGATAGLRSMTDEFLLATLADDEEFRRRASISLAGVKTPFDRADTSDIACLSQMLNLGACYLSEQDETDDSTDIKAMTGVLHTLTSLIDGEIDETEPDEPDDTPMGMYSAGQEGDQRTINIEVVGTGEWPNDELVHQIRDELAKLKNPPLGGEGDPEQPAATTRTSDDDSSDPEPSEATTRSDSRSLFWLADTPVHLKETNHG